MGCILAQYSLALPDRLFPVLLQTPLRVLPLQYPVDLADERTPILQAVRLVLVGRTSYNLKGLSPLQFLHDPDFESGKFCLHLPDESGLHKERATS